MREPREVRDARRRRRARPRRAHAARRPHPGPHAGARSCSRTATRRGRRGRSSPATRCSPGRSGAPTCPAATTSRCCASLRDKLLTRDDDAVVLPGHGPTTTIGPERASNPFLQGLDARRRGAGCDRRWTDAAQQRADRVRRAQGRPGVLPAGVGRVRARPRHAAGRRRPRRLRADRAAGVRGHRALRPRRRRVHRRRQQGDVHLRRPRRPLGDAAPRGHRGRGPRGDRARAGPRPGCR